MASYFYSCDWGTTNLRVRLVEASTVTIVSSIKTDEGIAKVFSQWKTSNAERFRFYYDILQKNISKLKAPVGEPAKNIPVIISGMASSNIGMIELPYAQLPVGIDGSGLITQSFKSNDDFNHPLILISGVRTNSDLMRGEEVEVIGASIKEPVNEVLFILPGTHSKHVWIHDDKIIDVKTHMTGELFQLLVANSILSNSIEPADDFTTGWEKFFEEGIMQSVNSGVFDSLFGVRVAHLFNKRTTQQNRYYLNGLLIGNELKSIAQSHNSEIVVVSNGLHKTYYMTALELLNVAPNKRWVNSEIATVNGHNIIFQTHIKL